MPSDLLPHSTTRAVALQPQSHPSGRRTQRPRRDFLSFPLRALSFQSEGSGAGCCLAGSLLSQRKPFTTSNEPSGAPVLIDVVPPSLAV